MKGMSGLDLLRAVRQIDPACAVLMITAYGTQRIAVEAMKAGAEDYLPKPFDNDELRIKVRKVMEKQLLQRAPTTSWSSRSARELGPFRGHGRRLARDDARVRDHREGRADRRDGADSRRVRHRQGAGRARDPLRAVRAPAAAFVAVNCAAFSRELVESELFGHEKGAFTGAVARREGKFEAADGGTLFLDEIGDMSLETQAKLLRAIQEKRFERVGGNQPLSVERAHHRGDQPGPRSDGR